MRVAVYAATIFSGAFLLFLVQPMFGRMVLPLLGGSPAVWNSCMLFFQAALLAGYLYAHVSSRLLDPPRQAAVHLALIVAAGALLPLEVSSAVPRGSESPIAWLLLHLTSTIGFPFLVLAGTGPILQRWFARAGSAEARDPYWLFAASNAGSLLALLAYPLLVEPRLRLGEQSGAWTLGYGFFALLMAACGASVWRAPRAAILPVAERGMHEALPIPVRTRLIWVALAFLPSSLLLGVTTYLTTDLTPTPFLWVLPLGIYLLSFILVFAERPPIPHRAMVFVQPTLIVAVLYLLLGGSLARPAVAVPVHLLGLFVTAMVCHGALAHRRPAASRLTQYYLWVAVGGVLGGVFNVLVAPILFVRNWEYPLVLVIACLARPWPRGGITPRGHLRYALRATGFAVVLFLLTRGELAGLSGPVFLVAAAVFVALLSPTLGRAPLWLALCLGSVYLLRAAEDLRETEVLHADRSFFGHYQVTAQRGRQTYHVLTHGSTLHGAQNRAPELRGEPLTYYLRSGPLGDIFATMGVSTRPLRVAVVGLGVGTAAAYAEAEEGWSFFEIDPGIERIARDPRLFTYLRDAAAEIRVVIGDGRLSLREETRVDAPRYDLIVLDAFTSDAIPVHLLTREALEVYLSRLAPGGRIAFHVSNRYLDLEPVVAALARRRGLAVRVGAWPVAGGGAYRNAANWVVMAREASELGSLMDDGRWRAPKERAGLEAWTDDHSSILEVFEW